MESASVLGTCTCVRTYRHHSLPPLHWPRRSLTAPPYLTVPACTAYYRRTVYRLVQAEDEDAASGTAWLSEESSSGAGAGAHHTADILQLTDGPASLSASLDMAPAPAARAATAGIGGLGSNGHGFPHPQDHPPQQPSLVASLVASINARAAGGGAGALLGSNGAGVLSASSPRAGSAGRRKTVLAKVLGEVGQLAAAASASAGFDAASPKAGLRLAHQPWPGAGSGHAPDLLPLSPSVSMPRTPNGGAPPAALLTRAGSMPTAPGAHIEPLGGLHDGGRAGGGAGMAPGVPMQRQASVGASSRGPGADGHRQGHYCVVSVAGEVDMGAMNPRPVSAVHGDGEG